MYDESSPESEKEVIDISEVPDFNLPTQTQFPLKAVLRTVVAYVLGIACAALIKAIPGIEALVMQAAPYLVDSLTQGLAVLIAGFWTWVMARPRVNAFLTWIGLGAAPRRAI